MTVWWYIKYSYCTGNYNCVDMCSTVCGWMMLYCVTYKLSNYWHFFFVYLCFLFLVKPSTFGSFAVTTLISLKWKDALLSPSVPTVIWHCSLRCWRAVCSLYTSYSICYAGSSDESEVKSRIAESFVPPDINHRMNAPHQTSIFQHSWRHSTLWSYMTGSCTMDALKPCTHLQQVDTL